jgi:hypothetical protein
LPAGARGASGFAAGADEASIPLASRPDFSTTRRVSEVNSIALRNAISRL